MADERDPRGDDFAEYLDALLQDARPSPRHVADADEAEMARLAAEMAAASGPADLIEPNAAFVEQLRLRMRAADEGATAVQVPPPIRESSAQLPPEPAGWAPWRISRRNLLRAGIGVAAGLGVGTIGSALAPRSTRRPTLGGDDDLVAGDGFWQEVALLSELTPGSALRFSTAAFDGFVVNDDGDIHALSSVCSHMGCTLLYRPEWRDLRCPCHGASFDLAGRLANGRGTWRDAPYRGDASAYPIELPDLVRPRVKIDGDRVLVWTAQA